jgi:hypothetical protein
MKLLKRLRSFLFGRRANKPPDTLPERALREPTPEENLERATYLIRRVLLARRNFKSFRRATQRWASFEDCHPLPRTTAEIEQLVSLHKEEVAAVDSFNNWIGDGKEFPANDATWPSDVRKELR